MSERSHQRSAFRDPAAQQLGDVLGFLVADRASRACVSTGSRRPSAPCAAAASSCASISLSRSATVRGPGPAAGTAARHRRPAATGPCRRATPAASASAAGRRTAARRAAISAIDDHAAALPDLRRVLLHALIDRARRLARPRGSSNDDVLDRQLIAALGLEADGGGDQALNLLQLLGRARPALGASRRRPAPVVACWSSSRMTATERRAMSPGGMTVVPGRPADLEVGRLGGARGARARAAAAAAAGAGRRRRLRPARCSRAPATAATAGADAAPGPTSSDGCGRPCSDPSAPRSLPASAGSSLSATLTRTRSAPTTGSSSATTRVRHLALEPLLPFELRRAERVVVVLAAAAPADGRSCRG